MFAKLFSDHLELNKIAKLKDINLEEIKIQVRLACV